MTYLTVQHKVRDYKTWKETFDKFESTRKSGGEKAYHILNMENDPNSLYVMFEWDSREKANSFFESAELKTTMEKAGVTEKPKITFLKHLEHRKL